MFERATETVKGIVSGDEDEFVEEKEFEEEFDEDGGSGGVQEQEEMIWDDALDASLWYLSEFGIPDAKSLGDKIMFYEMRRSNKYRDRLEHGVGTINMVSQSVNNLKEAAGEDTEDTDYGQLAGEINEANDLIRAVEELEGKDEKWAQDILGFASDVGLELTDRIGGGGGGAVDAAKESREGDL